MSIVFHVQNEICSLNLLSSNKSLACPYLQPKEIITLAEASIQSSGAALDIFNQIMDQIGSTDSLKKIATMIGDIKTLLIDGIGVYKTAPKSISEWCDVVTSLLAAYNDHKVVRDSEQRVILIKLLGDGDTIMNNAQNRLQNGSVTFNKSNGQLSMLENRLANDLDANNNESLKKLIADLNGKIASIREFFDQFICTKDHIAKEIREIGDLKVHTEGSKSYILLDDIPDLQHIVAQTTQNVITKCGEYRKKID